MRSYSSMAMSPRRLLQEAVELRRLHGDPETAAEIRVGRGREVESMIAGALGREVSGLDLLDIGCGQLPAQLIYFARRNRVVGIDADVVAFGASPRPYVRMVRVNGLQRTLKTIARKMLRVDATFLAAYRSRLDMQSLPHIDTRVMSAEQLEFPAESFDIAYALAVFQHVRDPERVLREMTRVTRPGGVVYFDFILYTGITGAHDLRVHDLDDSSQVPPWAHLRAEHRHLVEPSAYLNELRLPQWRDLVDRLLPGAEVKRLEHPDPAVRQEAERLRAAGDLRDYDLEELCTTKVAVAWQRPFSDPADR
jgi:SAM-dependent methyltransferase